MKKTYYENNTIMIKQKQYYDNKNIMIITILWKQNNIMITTIL